MKAKIQASVIIIGILVAFFCIFTTIFKAPKFNENLNLSQLLSIDYTPDFRTVNVIDLKVNK